MEKHPFLVKLDEIRAKETKHLPWSYREAKKLARERYPDLYQSWEATQPKGKDKKE